MSARQGFPTVLALVAGALLMVALVLFMPRVPTAGAQADPVERTIHVSGEALIQVIPDEVILTFGVETVNASLSAAKSENDTRVAAVLALGEKYGIQPEHIQTDFVQVQPIYEDYSNRGRIARYSVQKAIVFTLKDITRFEALYSDALEVGANYVHGIQFRTTELRKYRDQARDLAMRAAREKAVAMAGTLDQQVGEPTQISEGETWWWSGYSRYGGGGGGMSQNVVQAAPGEGMISEEGSFAPGRISVSARVQVTFALR